MAHNASLLEQDEWDVLFNKGTGGPAAAATEDVAVEEDTSKKTVTVVLNGVENIVSWYSDMTSQDVMEAIMCACDAIIDSGFDIRDENGKTIDTAHLHELRNGGRYTLERGIERPEYRDVLGDRFRKIKVQVDPLQHVEALKAIEKMKKGTNLLKHTKNGYPHMRQFQLSADGQRLLWYTSSKDPKDATIFLRDVAEIRVGQTTAVFKKYPLKMLDHLSFSLVLKASYRRYDTLDLTCKDEYEFDLWVAGLKAQMYAVQGRSISKEVLMSHSRRFKELLRKSTISGVSAILAEQPRTKLSVTLDDCIDMGPVSAPELMQKADDLEKRYSDLKKKIDSMADVLPQDVESDMAKALAVAPVYQEIILDEEDAEDVSTEHSRMLELLASVLEGIRICKVNLRSHMATADVARRKGSGSSTHRDRMKNLPKTAGGPAGGGKAGATGSAPATGAGAATSRKDSASRRSRASGDEDEGEDNEGVSKSELLDDGDDFFDSAAPAPSVIHSSYTDMPESQADAHGHGDGDDSGAAAASSATTAASADGVAELSRGKTLKEIDSDLWKVEIDLENVDDMYQRQARGKSEIATSTGNVIQNVFGWMWGRKSSNSGFNNGASSGPDSDRALVDDQAAKRFTAFGSGK